MATITITVDVLNAHEVVSIHKGRLVGWLASRFKSEAYLKGEIEKLIAEELVTGIRSQLNDRLQEEGVAANLKISVKE